MKARVMVVLSMCALVLMSRSFFNAFTTKPVSFALSSSSCLSGLSACECDTLRFFLEQQQTRIADSSVLSSLLLKQFPGLKKVTMDYRRGKFIVHLQAARPVALFNDELVLTDRHTLVGRSVWKQEILREIPHITVADVDTLTTQHHIFLKQLARAVQGTYTVEWKDEFLIKFHDTNYPRITLLGSAFIEPSAVLHPFCDDLKEKIKKEKMGGKKERNWCIDVRFKNQMVVYAGA